MTDYRLEMNALDASLFKFCFLCGAPLEDAAANTMEHIDPEVITKDIVCSKNMFHVRISVLTDEYDFDEGTMFK